VQEKTIVLPEMRAGQISANVRNFLFGLLFAGALGAYAFAVYQAAWLCDDAYITFRVIDNLWHGYGLRWNVAERVQPYTHPLWLWVLALPLGITREFFLTPMLFSMGVALAAALFTLLRFARSLGGVILAGLLFVSSRAFAEYSTSGLENPLAYLLFVLFCAVALRRENEPSSVMRQTASVQSAVRGPLFRLTFLSTLLILTRADYALVCFPFLVYEAWYGVRRIGFRGTAAALVLGFLPMVLWEVFSVVYYGFPFPNTAYAKLGAGIPVGEMAYQGLLYYLHSLQHDPVTLPVIALGLIAGLSGNRRHLLLAVGLAFYLVYIVRIGGDFMTGRYFAVPYAVSLYLLLDQAWARRFIAALPIGLLALGGSFLCPGAPLAGTTYYDTTTFTSTNGIMNERGFYYTSASLKHWSRGKAMPTHSLAERGRKHRLEGTKVAVHGSVGFTGFFSGPEVRIIDYYGLTDALLARLPSVFEAQWRIGHFTRVVPERYEETVREGVNRLADPDLARYYDALVRITQGPLWSAERWRAILTMNLGGYDALIHRDAYRFPRLTRVGLEELPQRPLAHVYEVRLPERSHVERVSLWAQTGEGLCLLFMDGEEILGRRDVPSTQSRAFIEVRVPLCAQRMGFTALRLAPVKPNRAPVVSRVLLAAP